MRTNSGIKINSIDLKVLILLGLIMTGMKSTPQKKSKHNPKDFKTKYLIEIISPGTKTPDYPDLVGDIVKKYGPDALTPNGQRQHYTLGQQIREDYSSFFKGEASTKDYVAYSAQSPASQSSARSHLYGLFPKFKINTINMVGNDTRFPAWEKISDNFELTSTSLPFGYKPSSLIIESEAYDTVFFPSLYKACPNAGREQVSESTGNMIMLEAVVKDFGNKLMKQGFTPQKYFDKQVWIPERLSIIYDSINSQYFTDNKLVALLKTEDLKSLQLISGMYKIAKHFPNELNLKVYTHNIAELMIESFTMGPQQGRKYTLFSGLDKTLLAFMNSLKLTNFECLKDRFINDYGDEKCLNPPQFASNLLFVLTQNLKGEDYVKTVFNGKSVAFCDEVEYAEYCPYEVFVKKAMGSLMLDSLSNFCGDDEMVSPGTVELENSIYYLGLAKYSLMTSCLAMLFVIVLTAFCFGEANFLNSRHNPLDPEGKFLENNQKSEMESQQNKDFDDYDARIKSHPTEPAELEPQPLGAGMNFDASREEEDPSFRFDQDELKNKGKKHHVDVTDTDRQGINESINVKENDTSYMGNKVEDRDPI